MASISSRNLVDAVLRVECMSFEDRARLAEEVHAGQPNLFFSVLVLQRYEATLEQIEVVLNLLLVFYEAMKISGGSWPVITEDVQERCLARISGRVRFIEGLTPQRRATTPWRPPEPWGMNVARQSTCEARDNLDEIHGATSDINKAPLWLARR